MKEFKLGVKPSNFINKYADLSMDGALSKTWEFFKSCDLKLAIPIFEAIKK